MFNARVCVLLNAVPRPAGKPVKFWPSPVKDPLKLVALTMPLKLAPPSLNIVAPVPIGVSPPRTLIPAASTPTLWTFVDPV